jgi:hypothetical protein
VAPFDADPLDPSVAEWARECALRAVAVRTSCVWCGLKLRPCNLERHIRAAHYRQEKLLELPVAA